MMKFWQNFKILSSPEQNIPLLSSIAGNDGESEFAKYLSKVDDIIVFKNKRIKDDKALLHEIDFIILDGKKIYLAEVKNWSGIVEINDKNEWIQTNKQKNINHSNPLSKLLKNQTFFVDYLISNNIDISKYEILPKVVFIKSNLRFRARDKLYVQTRDEFIKMLNKKRNTNIRRTRNDPELIQILSSLTVWSRLYLYGGDIILGSICYFIINGKKVRLPKHFRINCDLKWKRNVPISFISSLFGKRKKIKIKSKIFKVGPNDSIAFLQTGKSGMKLFKFGIIEQIIKDDLD